MMLWLVKGRREVTEVRADSWLEVARVALPRLGFGPDAFPAMAASSTRDGGVRIRDTRTGALLMDLVPMAEGLLAIDDLGPEDLQTEERLEDGETEEVVRSPAARTLIPLDNLVFPAEVEARADEPTDEEPATLEVDAGSMDDLPPPDLAEMLFEHSSEISGAITLELAAERALDLLRSFVPAESASVLYAGINDTALRFLAADGPYAHEVRDLEVPLGRGVAGFCFDTGRALHVHDVADSDRHLHEVDADTGYRPSSVLATPIRDDAGRTWGCLELLHPVDAFRPWHLAAAEGVAMALASRFSAGA